jgi:hypothetical protein
VAAAIGNFDNFPVVEVPSEAEGSKHVRLFGIDVLVNDSICIIKINYINNTTTAQQQLSAPNSKCSESVDV